jgi:hypothetical protein
MGGTVRQGNGGLKREGRKMSKLRQGNSGSATKEEKNEGRKF